MKDFSGKLAVVTGAGTGMGRELAKQLAAAGCHVAFCDVAVEAMAETKLACEALAPAGTKVTAHSCDVSDEAQVLAFRDAVKAQHKTQHINLLFNNAGIGGMVSFVRDDRADWERTFNICWYGVYYCARAFMPMLIASDEGCIINTSSVNGFWASLGPGSAHTAYSTAKFAVKGFTESLINDLRVNAPHVTAALVMPGHVGTDIGLNSRKALGKPPVDQMADDELLSMRERVRKQGVPVDKLSDAELRAMLQQRAVDFRDKAPLSAAGAATIILDGVRDGRWRILVGEDAKLLDQKVRESPEKAYDPTFFEGWAAMRRAKS